MLLLRIQLPAEKLLKEMLLATKWFIPPRVPHRVERPRLNTTLAAALSPENRLVLVCAPAGYGKSSLLSDWIHSGPAGIRFNWLSLDAADNDPQLFFAYLAASLANAAPAAAEQLTPLIESPQPVPAELFTSTLVNALAAEKDAHMLVLDDYQLIQSAPIHATLTSLIDHAPPGFHLVVISRADPPFPLHRYRARGQLVEIRMAELRFTLPEITGLLDSSRVGSLGPAEIDILENRTEGWVAGIQMAVLSLRGNADPTQFFHNLAGSQRFILDYLTEEALKQQPEPVQRFLLETSILSRLNADLCDAVATMPKTAGEEYSTSRDILAHLEHSNLFLIPLDNEGVWFRYHHLFADLLQARLRQSADADREIILQRRACEWFEKAGLTAEAIQYAILGKDFEKAARLVEQNTL
ncbi:hypothetical protein EHM76_03085, partial [bacterium]